MHVTLLWFSLKMHKLILTLAGLIVLSSLDASAQVYGGIQSNHGAVITATSGYVVPEQNHGIESKDGANVYHSSYKAPDYGRTVVTQHWDNIFNKKREEKRLNPYDEKVLRKAYNEYIDNKLALKKRIVTKIIQKTVDKTVDVTASLTKYAVDFISKLSIDTAAKIAKNGAHAVLHKKDGKFSEKYHH